jgi:branched-chain amino acid transport system substrate-binding protein
MSRLVVKPLLFIIVVMLIIVMFLSGACKEQQTSAKINSTDETASKTTPGVSDHEIRIGTLVPLSGSAAAAWGIPVSKGMKAYYDYINAQGGIYGRKIRFIIGDNQYTGPVSSEAARRLVEQDGVFAIQGSLGTEAHSAIWKYLEDKGVPDMFILSGNTLWTDPVARSRFGFLVDYVTEGRVLGKYIGENFNGKKLGILEQNDDFGKEGEEGLRTGIEDTGAKMDDIVVESYDAIQTDVTAQVQRLKNAGVDVIAAYAMPTQIGSLFKTARETLNWNVPMVLSGVDAAEIVATLAGYDNIEGTVSVTIGHQAFETDQPGIARHIAILQEYAPGLQIDNLTILGAIISETMVEILKQAGPDLTREDFLDAAESMCNYVCSMCLTPFTMTPDDHRPVEVEMYVRATVDRSTNPPTFRWQRFGDLYGFETTKECVPPTPPAGYEK